MNGFCHDFAAAEAVFFFKKIPELYFAEPDAFQLVYKCK
jgi:hypothetical protein